MYNYDRGGNITSKVKYAYTTGTLGSALQTIPYVYGDSNWKDKLTSYNGQTIIYDAIGNPLNDGAWTFTWAAGRQLKKMVREDRTLDFKYDHNGMRIQKMLQHDWYPETTKYTYHGKLLTHMTVDYTDWDEVAQQDKLHFFYDADGRIAKASYNGVIYTYIHNLQGDIVGLLDSAGALVVEYKYDVWGRLLSTTGSLADTLGKRNPFRYREYVYDEETELYYLDTRYYSSTWMRFVSADDYISTDPENDAIIQNNLYQYAVNNPVNRVELDGQISASAVANRYGARVLSTLLLAGRMSRWAALSKAAAMITSIAPYLFFIAAAAAVIIVGVYLVKAAELDRVKKKVSSRLKLKDGRVNIDLFNRKGPRGKGGAVFWLAKNGWRIIKDWDEHKGVYKLFDNLGRRIATLAQDGTILGK